MIDKSNQENPGLIADLPPVSRWEWKWLTAICSFAFLLRLAVAFYFRKGDFFWSDEWFYDNIARNLLDGQGYVAANPKMPLRAEPNVMWPPGLPIWLAFVYLLTGGKLFAARLAGTLVAMFGIAVLWLIGREMRLSPWVRLASITIVSVYPYYMLVPATIYPQTWTSTLLAVCIWQILRCRRTGSYVSASMAGLAIGSASLFVPYTILTAVVAIPWLASRRGGGRSGWGHAAAYFLLAMAIFSVWPIRNYRIYHRPLVSIQLGFNLWTANNEQANTRQGNWIEPPPELQKKLDQASSELEQHDIYVEDAMRFIRSNPVRYIQLVLFRTVNFFSPYPLLPVTANEFQKPILRLIGGSTYGSLLVFAVAGIWILKGRNGRFSVLLAQYIPVFLVTAFIVYRDRYRLPLDQYLTLMAAVAVVALLSKKMRKKLPLLEEDAVQPESA